MYEMLEEQVCPYCDYVVEDHQSNWDEDEEDVTCSQCNKDYTAKAVYQFIGFQTEKRCQNCGEWSDEGIILCECEDED